ncbi:GLPGLI family protein [Flavobacterium hauense]
MNKVLLTSALLLCAVVGALAQEFRGLAIYESQITLPKGEAGLEVADADPEMDKLLQEALAGALHSSYTLNFDKTTSVYEQEVKINPKDQITAVTVSVGESGGIEYKNIKEKKTVIETILFDKEFLIVDNLENFDWKLEKETKKIGSYTCYKAIAIRKNTAEPEMKDNDKTVFLTGSKDEQKITAWYAPEIPVGNGPAGYWGLPGLILEVNDGMTSLLCSKLVLSPKERKVIKAPKKGKKVTRAEYIKIEEEKAKELEQMGDGGTIMIMGG